MLTYKQFFTSPFLQTKEAETDLAELLVNIGAWSQDKKEYARVSLVLLSCPDVLDPVERRRVEETQLKLATILQKYLNNVRKFCYQLGLPRLVSGHCP